MKAITLTIFTMLLLTSCKEKLQRPHTPPPEAQMHKRAPVYHTSHEPAKADAPFSDAVQVGDMYFLSGQIGMNQSTRTLVEGGIEAETKQTLENIKAVLAHHNLKLTDVVKAMVVLEDIEDFAAFNAIYKTYLPQKPARTTFAAKGLAAGAKIEIEVIAVRKK